MAYGKTLLMRAVDNQRLFRTVQPRETHLRDRSLNGKARIRARKAANKAGR